MTQGIDAGHAAADAIRADGWNHEVAAFDHGVNAAYEAANGNFGSAAVEVISAVNESIQAQADYYEANHTMMDSSIEHIQQNYESGEGKCNIL